MSLESSVLISETSQKSVLATMAKDLAADGFWRKCMLQIPSPTPSGCSCVAGGWTRVRMMDRSCVS